MSVPSNYGTTSCLKPRGPPVVRIHLHALPPITDVKRHARVSRGSLIIVVGLESGGPSARRDDARMECVKHIDYAHDGRSFLRNAQGSLLILARAETKAFPRTIWIIRNPTPPQDMQRETARADSSRALQESIQMEQISSQPYASLHLHVLLWDSCLQTRASRSKYVIPRGPQGRVHQMLI